MTSDEVQPGLQSAGNSCSRLGERCPGKQMWALYSSCPCAWGVVESSWSAVCECPNIVLYRQDWYSMDKTQGLLLPKKRACCTDLYRGHNRALARQKTNGKEAPEHQSQFKLVQTGRLLESLRDTCNAASVGNPGLGMIWNDLSIFILMFTYFYILYIPGSKKPLFRSYVEVSRYGEDKSWVSCFDTLQGDGLSLAELHPLIVPQYKEIMEQEARCRSDERAGWKASKNQLCKY